jgi:DNA-binding LacI/PurR family transcriptional regulator
MTAVRPSAPTLEEVAAEAGVSRSTASRVINGSTQVSDAVVASVRAAIETLNYMPNRAARSLANRQTMAIALVVPEETMRFFGDPYFASVVDGITRGIADSDYVLNLQLAGPGSTEKTIRYLRGGNVDGALVVSHHISDSYLASISQIVPMVYNGRPINPNEVDSYYVDVNNTAGAAQGTQHLVDIGRTRIATIAGPADMPAGIDRYTGWKSTLTAAGLPTSRVAYGDFTLAGGTRAMRELLAAVPERDGLPDLDGLPDFDGLFVASDLMAMGAMSVLRERGIRIPTDVAVVGFDDSSAAHSSEVPLTTVHQPSREMGEKMASMLLDLLRGISVEKVCIMPTSVIVRESA